MAAAALTRCTGWHPTPWSFHRLWRFPPAEGELTHLGAAWGNDALWAALFLFIPAAMFGIYLAGRLLRSA